MKGGGGLGFQVGRAVAEGKDLIQELMHLNMKETLKSWAWNTTTTTP